VDNFYNRENVPWLTPKVSSSAKLAPSFSTFQRFLSLELTRFLPNLTNEDHKRTIGIDDGLIEVLIAQRVLSSGEQRRSTN